jgi:hypothetical protein
LFSVTQKVQPENQNRRPYSTNLDGELNTQRTLNLENISGIAPNLAENLGQAEARDNDSKFLMDLLQSDL